MGLNASNHCPCRSRQNCRICLSSGQPQSYYLRSHSVSFLVDVMLPMIYANVLSKKRDEQFKRSTGGIKRYSIDPASFLAGNNSSGDHSGAGLLDLRGTGRRANGCVRRRNIRRSWLLTELNHQGITIVIVIHDEVAALGSSDSSRFDCELTLRIQLEMAVA